MITSTFASPPSEGKVHHFPSLPPLFSGDFTILGLLLWISFEFVDFCWDYLSMSIVSSHMHLLAGFGP
jgi:hypothetical protein